jgi:hypothetical protein
MISPLKLYVNAQGHVSISQWNREYDQIRHFRMLIKFKGKYGNHSQPCEGMLAYSVMRDTERNGFTYACFCLSLQLLSCTAPGPPGFADGINSIEGMIPPRRSYRSIFTSHYISIRLLGVWYSLSARTTPLGCSSCSIQSRTEVQVYGVSMTVRTILRLTMLASMRGLSTP